MKINNFLFKAKRIDNGEWIIGYLYRLSENHPPFIMLSDRHGESYEVDPSTICRYTGLTDKNGRKIWEHDIVDFLGQKGKIRYECGCFGIAYSNAIDWEEIADNIFPITGCTNPLNACENDNFISLWEIMWNYNDEEDSIGTVEVIGNSFDTTELSSEKDFKKVINSRSTAYDPDKVVEELEAYQQQHLELCEKYGVNTIEDLYDKALDDFIHECDKKCGFYSGVNKNITREDMLIIAKQLKAGARK